MPENRPENITFEPSQKRPFMEKLTVRICTGTLCYIMGGSELQLLGDYLPESLTDRVEIREIGRASCRERV